MDKSRGLDVVEYRESGKVLRLFLRRHQDPPPEVPKGLTDLRHWFESTVYHVSFKVAGCIRIHGYPVHELARWEEEVVPHERDE